ncbi:hypothetical protein DVR12_11375 [Chitinophaga silvatica]|uniref:Chloride channel protein n=1 Tax=Chitinophaga silvatica TaxID=2282649 RepID=A0A3E1Y9V1_9BACT|nr:chloride channel protein [Chitinophaga silvatica]RFS22406.1 hypothetical protein DVR12_11375 [Chitinophaga silvatica]
MQNIFYNINRIGTGIAPVFKTGSSTSLPLFKKLGIAAIISFCASLFTAGCLWGIKQLNSDWELPFYFPLLATGIWILIDRYLPAFLQFIGATIATTIGAPLGLETSGFIFSKALANKFTKQDQTIFYYSAIAGVIATAFGAPVAALCFALEVWLLEWTIVSILPIVIGSTIGAAFSYLIHDSIPVFTTSITSNEFTWNIYIAIGIIMGLWATLTISLTKLTTRALNYLKQKNYWWLLIPALALTLIYYYSPSGVNNTYSYLDALLHARVTLFMLFSLAILKWLSWILYNSFFKTGTGIVPLLLSGGAFALFAGVLLQLIFPAIKIDAGLIVLLGMTAMLAGTSRGVVAAIIFSLELTHKWEVTLPIIMVAIVSYSLPLLILRKKHKIEEA